MYYLRTRPAANAIKFTVDVEALLKESCEGFELKHFNSNQPAKELARAESGQITAIIEEKENIDSNVLQPQNASELNIKAVEKESQDKKAPAACPLRKKKKNENGEVVEDDEECLACGS